MANGIVEVPPPVNERVLGYAPGSPERDELGRALTEISRRTIEIAPVVGGRRLRTKKLAQATAPHDHRRVLAQWHRAGAKEVGQAIRAAREARRDWSRTPWEARAAIFLRAAELLAGPWRMTLNAATMLGQSKTCHQAEIDSACELIDFLRFNVHYAAELSKMQPISPPGQWNRVEMRPLDGFVFAITPFNFTAIAGNLPSAPALLGNTVVWKPAATQMLAANVIMELFEAAGLPAGVIKLVTGSSSVISDTVLASPNFGGIHFTGSTAVFQDLWKTVGKNIAHYHQYPRLVGETGGKDFIFAHPSANADALVTAIVRGGFEYQGQ